VIDPADIVAADRFQDLLGLRAVDVIGGTLARDAAPWRHPNVGGDDLVAAVSFPQGRNKLRTDLTQRARHENPSHVISSPGTAQDISMRSSH